MKDYSCLIVKSRKHLEEAYDKGYEQGIQDGNINDGTFAQKVKEAYQNGLDDAWECLRKIFDRDEYGMQAEVFGTKYYPDILEKYSASEALQKIREHEEKQRDCKTCKHSNNGKIAFTETCHECIYNSQYEEKHNEKSCDNCQYKDKLDAKCLFCDKEQNAEIKVGDEVIHEKHGKGVVIGLNEGFKLVAIRFANQWTPIEACYDSVTRTGRTFPTIKIVLEAMEE